MKTVLITLGTLIVVGLIALVLGVKYLAPMMLAVGAPSGAPIGELDSPRVESSRIVAEIMIPTTTFDALANAKIPATYEGKESKSFHKNVRNGSAAWKVQRGDVHFFTNRKNLAFEIPFAGAAALSGEVDAMIIRIPINGNAELAGSAGGTLTPEIGNDWTLKPNLAPDLRLDKANLNLPALGTMDISEFLTSNLGQKFQDEIQKKLPTIKEGISLEERITKLWNQAHQMRQISENPPLWLRILPKKLLLSPFDYSMPDHLRFVLAMDTEASIHNRLVDGPEITPLPPAESLTTDIKQSELVLPAILSFAELNNLLDSTELDLNAGAGTKIKIHGLVAEAGEDGYINLKLNIDANKSRLGRGVTGTIWVKGRPWIDYDSQTLGFGEVALTVETQDTLTSTASWLLEGFLINNLESKLRVNLNDHREKIDEKIQKATSDFKLSEGARLSLQNHSVKLSEVYTVTRHSPEGEPDPAIVIVVRATGDLRIWIDHLDFEK